MLWLKCCTRQDCFPFLLVIFFYLRPLGRALSLLTEIKEPLKLSLQPHTRSLTLSADNYRLLISSVLAQRAFFESTIPNSDSQQANILLNWSLTHQWGKQEQKSLPSLWSRKPTLLQWMLLFTLPASSSSLVLKGLLFQMPTASLRWGQ